MHRRDDRYGRGKEIGNRRTKRLREKFHLSELVDDKQVRLRGTGKCRQHGSLESSEVDAVPRDAWRPRDLDMGEQCAFAVQRLDLEADAAPVLAQLCRREANDVKVLLTERVREPPRNGRLADARATLQQQPLRRD
jgi:hypothetical protein